MHTGTGTYSRVRAKSWRKGREGGKSCKCIPGPGNPAPRQCSRPCKATHCGEGKGHASSAGAMSDVEEEPGPDPADVLNILIATDCHIGCAPPALAPSL